MGGPNNVRKQDKTASTERAPQQGNPTFAKTGQKRGRPRVEERDATAIERRRTQIRVAQRAYRARKDSTIIDLQARVDTLQQVLQDATTNLQVISEKLAVDDDHSSARANLHSTISKLMELHKTAGSVKHDSNSDDNETPPGVIPPISNIEAAKTITHLAEDYTVGDEPGSLYADTTNAVSNEGNIAWSDPFSRTTDDGYSRETFLRSSITTLQLSPQVTAAPTFSWQETTFARRLMRHAHELCLRHLENPTEQYGQMLNRVRYSLTFMSEAALVQKLKRTVAKSKSEPLEDWSMPVPYVGGAGKHYERTLEEEGIQATNDQHMGPFQIPSATYSIPTSLFPDRVAEWLGLDGVWFDHHDVEAYLRLKGLKLDSAASTAIFEISSSSNSWPSTNENDFVPWLNTHNTMTGGIADFMQSSGKNSLADEGKKPQRHTGVVGNERSTQQLVLSIDRLIEELNNQAVCLGRAPGYRQSDVDKAFDKIMAEAGPITD